MDSARYNELSRLSLGYPSNLSYDFSGIADSINWNLNNIGDPSAPGTYLLHSKEEELRVVQFFRDLWNAPDDSWGYVSSSGSEGNLQGILSARDDMGGDPVLYASSDTHYSIAKIAKMLKIKFVLIASDANGRVEIEELENALDLSKPAIVCANVGSTFKGAVDDTKAIKSVMVAAGIPHRIHADAALFGGILPFVDDTSLFEYVDSMSVSGHKFFGVPFPCGVFLSRKHPQPFFETEVTGSIDTTVSGSRSGHGALFLDHIIQQKGIEGLRKDVLECIENAEYLINITEPRWGAWRNNQSPIVVMKRPPDDIVKRWQLASQGNLSHVVTMPHANKRKLNILSMDLRRHTGSMRSPLTF